MRKGSPLPYRYRHLPFPSVFPGRARQRRGYSGIITAICPHVGYQKAAEIAKQALQTGETVRSLILKEGLLTEEELEKILSPVGMTEPGISGKEYLMKKAEGGRL